MLLPIAVDPDSLADAGATRVQRDVIRDALDGHGVLHTTTDELRAMRDGLRSRPSEWARWHEVLLRVPRRVRPSHLPPTPDLDVLGFPAGDPGLVVLGSKRADRWLTALGVPLEEGRTMVNGSQVEVVCGDHVTASEHLQVRKNWSNSDLTTDEDGATAWEERLRPLFLTARRVSIVDRYLVSRFASASVDAPGACGVTWLLDQVGRDRDLDESPVSIELYGMLPGEPWSQTPQLAILVDDLWRRCGTSAFELQVYLCPEERFRPLEHRRYIRFSTDRTVRLVEFDDSLDAIGPGRFGRTLSFSYRLAERQRPLFVNAEERLQQLATRSGSAFKRMQAGGLTSGGAEA